MSTNPFVNALSASLYIALVSSGMFFAPKETGPDTVLIPIAMISLLTLSVAVMAYLFFYQPIRLFLEGEKQRAVNLLMQTIGIFAVITALLFATLYVTTVL